MLWHRREILFLILTGYLKKIAQPIDCAYVCSCLVANKLIDMRRDVFQAIADPTCRAILGLLGVHAMTPNALAEYFGSSRQALSKHIKILTECQPVKQEQSGRRYITGGRLCQNGNILL